MKNPYFIVERVGMDTETSYNKYPEFQVWEEGKQATIKEMVEFIEKRRNTCQLNTEQFECRLCLSELLEALRGYLN